MSRLQSRSNQTEPGLSYKLQALQTTFRGMESSPALKAQAEAKFLKLSKQYGHMLRCHVVVERPASDMGKGTTFSVRVQLHAEGHSPTVSQSEHVSAAVALREAFERMSAQLAARGERLSYARRMMVQ